MEFGLPNPIEWAQQFAKQDIKSYAWEEEFSQTNEAWTEQFELYQNQQYDGEAQQEKHLYEQDQHHSQVKQQEDWATMFKEKMSLMPQDEADQQWTKMDKSWEKPVDGRFEEYTFATQNPYHTFDSEFLNDTTHHRNLTESLLALEAAVQKEPRNARAWLELGRRQQENENETAAIAALRKAVELDANNLEALLYLSVSYTNENYSNEAYDTLQQWIACHPKYSSLAPPFQGIMSIAKKHDQVTHSFMQAALTRPGQDMDEDVQTALGILFNISSEYPKAVDCFEAAISKRPQDYQLWNKLG